MKVQWQGNPFSKAPSFSIYDGDTQHEFEEGVALEVSDEFGRRLIARGDFVPAVEQAAPAPAAAKK